MTTAASMTRTLRTLLSGLVDYAGLFPPANLDMPTAAQHYARDLMGEFHWALGRFVCPASRLEELTEHGRILMPGTHGFSGYREHADLAEPWKVSAILDLPLGESLDAIDDFNQRHASEDDGLARVDSCEVKAKSPGFIDAALDQIPEDVMPFFEIDVMGDADLRGIIASLAGHEGAAKIRCGGIEPEMIPSVDRVAEFIALCATADVRFKATAGLHHPIRAEHPLTYENNPPRAVMHGFVNVFIAAALARSGKRDVVLLREVLEETDASAFCFDEDRVSWRDQKLDPTQLARAREAFSLSYGSCSFTEPIDDLKTLGWIGG